MLPKLLPRLPVAHPGRVAWVGYRATHRDEATQRIVNNTIASKETGFAVFVLHWGVSAGLSRALALTPGDGVQRVRFPMRVRAQDSREPLYRFSFTLGYGRRTLASRNLTLGQETGFAVLHWSTSTGFSQASISPHCNLCKEAAFISKK